MLKVTGVFNLQVKTWVLLNISSENGHGKGKGKNIEQNGGFVLATYWF